MSNELIRVLHIGLCPNHGGIESIVHSWWQNIDKNRFQFDFLNVYHTPIAFEDEFKEGGSKVHYITVRKENPWIHHKELKQVIKDNNYNFVHCHVMSLSEPEPVQICNSKTITAIPIVHSHHAVDKRDMSLPRKVLHSYGKHVLNRSHFLRLACGYDAGKQMFESDEFTVIENGIDIKEHKFSEKNRRIIREKYHISDDTYLIGHVGRNDRQKNYPLLLESFADLKKRYNKSRLILIGNIRTEEIDRLIECHNIQDSVIFTGRVDNTSAYYSAMDCFYMPSLREGLSISLVEAQASGLHCVVSSSIAKESAVSDLVSFVSLDEKQKIIEELLKWKDENIMDRMRSAIYDQYDIRNSTRKLENYYLMNRRK